MPTVGVQESLVPGEDLLGEAREEKKGRTEEKEEIEIEAAITEGRTVASKRKRRRRRRKVQALPSEPERKPPVKEQAPRPPQAEAGKGRTGP